MSAGPFPTSPPLKTGRTLVVIPAYDEEGRVGRVVRRVREAAPCVEILVVDDGSGDGTAREAREAGARVVSHPFNMGYGETVKTGLSLAAAGDFDIVVHMDGDGQHDPASMPGLLAAVRDGGADIAIGSRFTGGGAYRAPLLRRLGILIFSRIVSLAVGSAFTDPTSGFAALGRAAVLRLGASPLYPADFPDADLIIMAHRAGMRVVEVPVLMHESPPGKRSMHAGSASLYYVFKMFLAIFLALLRKNPF